MGCLGWLTPWWGTTEAHTDCNKPVIGNFSLQAAGLLSVLTWYKSVTLFADWAFLWDFAPRCVELWLQEGCLGWVWLEPRAYTGHPTLPVGCAPILQRHPRHWGFWVFAPGAEEVGVPCLETSACRGAPLHVPAVICQALNFSVNRKGPQEANRHPRFQRLRRLGCPAPG